LTRASTGSRAKIIHGVTELLSRLIAAVASNRYSHSPASWTSPARARRQAEQQQGRAGEHGQRLRGLQQQAVSVGLAAQQQPGDIGRDLAQALAVVAIGEVAQRSVNLGGPALQYLPGHRQHG
jgi:hypothetical protein